MIQRFSSAFTLALLLLTLSLTPVSAQGEEPGFEITLSRDFGYGGFGNDIQGLFSIKVKDGEDLSHGLSRVVFYIDDQVIGEDSEPPFKLQFETDSYPLGIHKIYAVGTTPDGTELRSNELRREFVSAQEGWKAAGKIVVPILVISLVVALLTGAGGIATLFGRGKGGQVPPGAPRSYGPLGGTICSKCGRPYGRHVWGLNIVVGKLDRCPHCGKWGIAARAHPDALRAAEQAELEAALAADAVPVVDEETQRKRDLDDSRYMDG